jgi:cell division protein FtsQ
MKLKWKIDYQKVWRRVLWSLVVVVFLLSVGFTETKRAELRCTGFTVRVIDTSGNSFIEASDIIQMVIDKIGNPQGMPMANINMAVLENMVLSNAFVAKAEVFSTADGKLTIEVVQRVPVIRIINLSGESFYIDDYGVFMPLSEKYTANVPIANGVITATYADKKIRTFTSAELEDTSKYLFTIEKLFHINQFVTQNEFWNAQVEQYYVNSDMDIEMIPRIGDHIIILGDEKNLEAKFDKLFHFYTGGLNKTGWNQYKTINLKFDGQVVCTKK